MCNQQKRSIKPRVFRREHYHTDSHGRRRWVSTKSDRPLRRVSPILEDLFRAEKREEDIREALDWVGVPRRVLPAYVEAVHELMALEYGFEIAFTCWEPPHDTNSRKFMYKFLRYHMTLERVGVEYDEAHDCVVCEGYMDPRFIKRRTTILNDRLLYRACKELEELGLTVCTGAT